jgi:hypothetical protein
MLWQRCFASETAAGPAAIGAKSRRLRQDTRLSYIGFRASGSHMLILTS